MQRNKAVIVSLALLLLVMVGLFVWSPWKYKSEAEIQNKLNLAVKYISEGSFEQAILAYNDAIKIDPKEVMAYQGLARVYTLQGRYDDAQKTYDQGLSVVDPQKQSVLRLGLAGLFVDKKDYGEAEKRFQALINENKASVEAYRGLALVYQSTRQDTKAEAVLQQCIQTNPQDYRSYNALASYYAAVSKRDQALAQVAKSVDLQVNQEEAYSILLGLYDKNWGGLLSSLSSSLNPQTASMLRFFALMQGEKYDQALAEYHASLEKTPENLKARVLAAVCMVKTGDKAGASSIIKKIKNKQITPVIAMDIAYYYSLDGQQDKARSMAAGVLSKGSLEKRVLKLSLEIFGKDSPEAQMTMARYVVLQWQPVEVCLNNLAASGMQVGFVSTDNSIQAFLKRNFPQLDESSLTNLYTTTMADVTGDGKKETILTSTMMIPASALVFEEENGAYRALFRSDTSNSGWRCASPVIDQYANLYLPLYGTGTGAVHEETVILRWDGQQLRNIWTGITRDENHPVLPGAQFVEDKGKLIMSGQGKGDALQYIWTSVRGAMDNSGQIVKTAPTTTTKEFRFDQQQFKFIETSSQTETGQTPAAAGGVSLPEDIFTVRGVRVGMTQAQVMSLLGKPDNTFDGENGTIDWEYNNLGVSFDPATKKVCTILPHTLASGLSIDDSYDKLVGLYGQGNKFPSPYGDPNWFTVTYRGNSEATTIHFIIAYNKIHGIMIGADISD